MANMSYCRFRNTLEDLRDCHENMDETVNAEEEKARKRLIRLCAQIADDYREDQ